MKQVICTEKKPIKLWLDDMEEGALAQAKNLANLPFIFKHIAIMPDSHQGYGMPIGGVMATEGVVVPNAVGVDIGCGMCAVKTSIQSLDSTQLKKIMSGVRGCVPVGFNKHSKKQDDSLMPTSDKLIYDLPICAHEHEKARKQLGTLGGGNHFIEIQQGDDGHIWVMIHSGSRNLGYTVAKHYNNIAKDLNESWKVSVPKEWELAYLPLDSREGNLYMNEMKYCVDFAQANRSLMMRNVLDCFASVVRNFGYDGPVNIAHNYAAMENHFGKNVMVHRKGATKAQVGQLGVIPGSQGTSSYIVVGKGEPDSFKSCSHGAGRKMGRKQAQCELNFEAEKSRLDDMGIIHTIRGVKDLDEAPGSYKDIAVVMENQSDLVEIKVELTPLAVIKG